MITVELQSVGAWQASRIPWGLCRCADRTASLSLDHRKLLRPPCHLVPKIHWYEPIKPLNIVKLMMQLELFYYLFRSEI